eukprot:scaffold9329_cov23-Cyclotella_meneghiniana.AAC.2
MKEPITSPSPKGLNNQGELRRLSNKMDIRGGFKESNMMGAANANSTDSIGKAGAKFLKTKLRLESLDVMNLVMIPSIVVEKLWSMFLHVSWQSVLNSR